MDSGRKKRSYEQYCGVARALDVLGERWTLLVIRDLLPGARRYGELVARLPGIGTDLLTARLRMLEQHGLVEREETGGIGGGVSYRLSAAGDSLRPLIEQLAQVGLSWLESPTDTSDHLDLAWALATVRVFLRAQDVPDRPIVLRGSSGRFRLAARGDVVSLTYVSEDNGETWIAGSDGEILASITGHTPFPSSLEVGGDGRLARRWVRSLVKAMPEQLAAAAV